MSKQKMLAARELIQEKRYAEARALLKTIDDPKAKEWLKKLDAVAPEQDRTSSDWLPPNDLMKRIQQPESNKKHEPEPLRKTKRCPFCAETIMEEAVVCRYCGRELQNLIPPDLQLRRHNLTVNLTTAEGNIRLFEVQIRRLDEQIQKRQVNYFGLIAAIVLFFMFLPSVEFLCLMLLFMGVRIIYAEYRQEGMRNEKLRLLNQINQLNFEVHTIQKELRILQP